MKTVFVVNPKAGQGKGLEKLYAAIEDARTRYELDVDIYTTTAAGDATRFVAEYCRNNPPARFIACGGDGTANEVLNGLIDFPACEMGVLPIGTGNDFCRNFPDGGDFKDVLAQVGGSTQKCDVIRVDTEEKSFYCLNMINIGFDSNVAAMTVEMKKKPFVSGPLAYFLSIFGTLIPKKGTDLKIEADGELLHDGPLLLTSIANGRFCGGGIQSNPGASVCDGLLNINIIYNISRLKFLRLLPLYMKGTHPQLRGVERYITNVARPSITVTPNTPFALLSLDGEIATHKKLTFTAVHEAVSMVIPTKDLGGIFNEQTGIRENVCAGQ